MWNVVRLTASKKKYIHVIQVLALSKPTVHETLSPFHFCTVFHVFTEEAAKQKQQSPPLTSECAYKCGICCMKCILPSFAELCSLLVVTLDIYQKYHFSRVFGLAIPKNNTQTHTHIKNTWIRLCKQRVLYAMLCYAMGFVFWWKCLGCMYSTVEISCTLTHNKMYDPKSCVICAPKKKMLEMELVVLGTMLIVNRMGFSLVKLVVAFQTLSELNYGSRIVAFLLRMSTLLT